MRKSNTEADMLEAAGDAEGAKAVRQRMAEQNKALKSYCEGNGLKYRSDRVRTYGAIAPKKSLDKSAESGIINSGSDAVALEYQRYGRNKATLVNKTYIDGGEYRRKFDSVSDNADVNKSVYNCAKSALKHRSGTVYEDMYWIDSETGSIIASEINSATQQEIVYSEATKKLVSSYEKGKIVTIHTHPNSMPPSVADFNSCFRNGYKQGYVACHDGKVFAYTSEQEVSEELYSLYISSYISEGSSEYEAQIKTLEKLRENHLIDFWEVTQYGDGSYAE